MKSTFIALLVLCLCLGGCGEKTQSEIVEEAIREHLEKPTGELTKADLEKVTSLPLTATQITDAGFKELAKLKNLTYLNLTGIKITDAGLKEIAKCRSLKSLILWHTQITDAGLKEVAKLQNLETLNLTNTQITDAGLKEVAKLAQLRILTLHDTQVTKAGVIELHKTLPKCGVRIEKRKWPSYASPPKAAPEKLIADPIVEKAIRMRLKKPAGGLTKEDLESVKTLFLFLNELTQVPKDLEKLKQLTELHLNNNKLNNVKGLEKLGQLKYLHLENNNLTNLKGLESLTHLKELDLNNNPDLTKAQIEELQKVLPACKISSNSKK